MLIFILIMLNSCIGSAPVPSPVEVDTVRFIVLGDQGSGGGGQRAVAKAMHRWASENPVDFVILLGDNFYSEGVDSINDPQWQSKFERKYAYPSLQVPFYAVLGNHDYRGNASAQVLYTHENKRWRMPDKYYEFFFLLDSVVKVQFVAIDTTPISKNKSGYKNQLKWLDRQLEASNADWKIVYGHHFIFSSGKYGTSKRMLKRLAPVLTKHKVDLYMSGHDHDLELLRSGSGDYYLISGAGAIPREVRASEKTLFASPELGFAFIQITKGQMTVKFITVGGGMEYEYTIKKNSIVK